MFEKIRARTEALCSPLKAEDFSAQPIPDVSPPKWHLGHTTWFFEAFILIPYGEAYVPFDEHFAYLFNSYYNFQGPRVARDQRGTMTRPPLEKVLAYRNYVNTHLHHWIEANVNSPLLELVELGLQHEQQHQELLIYDIKYILGTQALKEPYGTGFTPEPEAQFPEWLPVEEGVYEVGFKGAGFSFDNERPRHKVYVPGFQISNRLICNAEWMDFIQDGGYERFSLWHDEGWAWLNQNQIIAPLYWKKIDGIWHAYTMSGLQSVDPQKPVDHISFYEAFAFAEWAALSLPSEFQWEVASDRLRYGKLWEWTYSAYHPYPGYTKAAGALGEYNGKFMINQMVLRGGSVATPPGHNRASYRNFFPASSRWQFAGLRLIRPYS